MSPRLNRLGAFSGRSGAVAAPAAWTPASLPNLLAWYKAAAANVTLNGSTVSQWNDLSGNGRHLVQATATNQPTWEATGWTGSRPTITFDGTTDFLRYSGVNATSYANFSIWCVVRPAVMVQYEPVWWAPSGNATTGGTTGDIYLERKDPTANNALDYWINNVAALGDSGNNTFQNNTDYRLLSTYDGTTLRLYIDGVSRIASATASRRIGDHLHLASFRPFNTTFDAPIKISEFVVTTGALGASDQAELETYGQSEWF